MKKLTLMMCFVLLSAATAMSGEHKHVHKAPHGGALVVVGDEFAHLEFVLDKEGKLTAYVLDGEAEKAVRIKQKEIALKIESIDGKKQDLKVKLKAVANVLTGESEGDTSEFATVAAELKGAKKFCAELDAVKVKGKEFKDVHFDFPEGNEHGHHDHAHDHDKKEHKAKK